MGVTFADPPPPPVPGLDSRASIGPYLDGHLPSNNIDPMPLLLSDTGAFIKTGPLNNLADRTPHPGLVPYSLNSPLWTDGSDKSRYLGVPYGGATGNPTIGFNTGDFWKFPNGTVIVKNFDLILDENNPVTSRRRMETRILIRYNVATGNCTDGPSLQNGDCIRGATYRWRADNSDADLVTNENGITETGVVVIGTTGPPRTQAWLFPGPPQCNMCHNQNAGMVLGPKTAQLNGNHDYPTGRSANQLLTLNHLGMLDTNIGLSETYPQYAKTVAIDDITAPLEHRVRSYISSNCSFCHRPGGIGPVYDMRFETPILDTNIISMNGLIRDNLAASRFYVRDSSTVMPMPPIARNVPDQRVLSVYDQWVNYNFDVVGITALSPTQLRLQFNSALEATSATTIGNYAIDAFGVTVSQAVLDTDPSAVLLTTTSLPTNLPYSVTINRVRELMGPQQNFIFPNTQIGFSPPAAPTLGGTAAGNGSATLTFAPAVNNGNSAVTTYTASCTSTGANPTTISASGPGSPITVTGLTNGVTYSCQVTATNNFGTSFASDSMTVTPISPLLSVVSRKRHGGFGDCNLPVDSTAAIDAQSLTIEPRMTSGGHVLVFKFNQVIQSLGQATITGPSGQAIGTVTTRINNADTTEVIAYLSGIPDNQRVTVTLANVNNAGGSIKTSLGYLTGDVNQSRSVGSADVMGVKVNLSSPISAQTCKLDVNLSGTLTQEDVSAVKARAGWVLK